MRKWPVCDFSSRGWKTLDPGSALSPPRCRYWVGKAGGFFCSEKERNAIKNTQTRSALGATFLPLSLAPSPASSSAGNAKFSFSFPACCTFAAGDNFRPGCFPMPARPGHVEGQKIYKPALSSHINQGTLCL